LSSQNCITPGAVPAEQAVMISLIMMPASISATQTAFIIVQITDLHTKAPIHCHRGYHIISNNKAALQ
jgi:hypothetical protein